VSDRPATDDIVLRVEGLTRDFGALRAVDGVSLAVRRGTVHSLIGPNAAGKTTLFNLLSGEIAPTAGRIWFDGRDVTGLPSHRLPHLGLARCFQRNNLFPKLSVGQNVWLAAFSRRPSRRLDFLRRVAAFRDLDARVRAILADVDLAGKLEAPAETLSHGQQRALEVAIALANEPTFLLLDEPTQGLAPEATLHMTELIRRLAGRYTILLIEHKMHIVMSISDRISVMSFGQLLAEGTPDEIRGNEAVQQAYLGVRR
jgi:branched-chain amino acid transport system ATP-binding protein